MSVLGISCYYHDSAVALIDDNEIQFAIHEERLSRRKQDARFPALAVGRALESAKLRINDLDRIVFYEDPGLKLNRLWDQVIDYWPRSQRVYEDDITLHSSQDADRRADPEASRLSRPDREFGAPPFARRLGLLYMAVRA